LAKPTENFDVDPFEQDGNWRRRYGHWLLEDWHNFVAQRWIRLNAGGPLEIEAEKSDDGKRVYHPTSKFKSNHKEWFH
jgi:hypothetical protein